MATAALLPMPRAVFYDASGAPLAGGYVYTYVPGGTTPQTTWQDAAETTANSNPIVLDAAGSCLLYGSGSYQLTVTDSLGNAVPAYSGLTVDTLSTITAAPAITNIAALRAATTTSLAQSQCNVFGYYAAADGGGGTFVVGANASDNGGTIINDASGRSWHREASGPLSARWFGAYGNGTNDDTAAIQSTIAAAQITGAGVSLPAGNYKTSSTLTASAANVWITGAGVGSTIITSTVTATDVIYFYNATPFTNGGVRDLSIVGSGFSTAGAGVHLNAAALRLENLNISGVYNGVVFDTNAIACRATGVDVSSVVNDSFLISGGNNHYLENCTTFQQSGSSGGAGYHVTASGGGPWMTNCVSSSQTNGLLVAPAAGASILDMFVVNCDFDDSTNDGISIDSSAGGSIYALKFTNTRGCFSGLKGVAINGAGTYDIQFSNCEFSKNVQEGIYIAGGNYLGFGNCNVNGNSSTGGGYNGINLSGGTGIRFVGGKCGPFNAVGNNQPYGISIMSTFAGSAVIEGNDLNGNATGPLNNSSTSSAITISNNLGAPTRTSGLAVMPTGSTSLTVPHGLIAPPTLILVNGQYAGYTYADAPSGTTDLLITMSPPDSSGPTNIYWEAVVYNG